MPLTGTGSDLGIAIKSALDSLSDEDKRDRDKLFEEMGKAIIDHIIANGAAAVGSVVAGGGVGNII
jgi:hypothetical protein